MLSKSHSSICIVEFIGTVLASYLTLSIVIRNTGPGRAEQEGYRGDKIFHASAAESRDGNGGGDDPENLGTELDGVEASTSRCELPQHGKEKHTDQRSSSYPFYSKQNFTEYSASAY